MSQLGLNLGYLLVQIVCFLIIFIVVRAWIVKPLQGYLARRNKKIAQGLEDADIAAQARANAEKEATGIISDAQVRAAHIVNDATERADSAMTEVRAEADAEIVKQREAVLAEVEEERTRMLGDLRGQVAELAIAAARKLVGASLDEKRQHELLEEFFSGILAGKVQVLENINLPGTSADVVSALPLADDEKATIKSSILEKMNPQALVNFHVDPSILGGLVIRAGDKEINGSVQAQLEELRQSIR